MVHHMERLQNISIHSFQTEGDAGGNLKRTQGRISIHSFQTEGDSKDLASRYIAINISIHSFQTEGDHDALLPSHATEEFQSTPSKRKETSCLNSPSFFGTFQSTPSKRKETEKFRCEEIHLFISIHSFQTEGDVLRSHPCGNPGYFNPLLPNGRRPARAEFKESEMYISIHSFQTEGDRYQALQ